MSPSSARSSFLFRVAVPTAALALMPSFEARAGLASLEARASAMTSFENGLDGYVEGLDRDAVGPACGAPLPLFASGPGDWSLVEGNALVRPADGDRMLRLGGASVTREAPFGVTRWLYPFELDEPSILDASINFMAAEGASFMIRIDGRSIACGDDRGVQFDASPPVAFHRARVLGWVSLAKGADMRLAQGHHLLEAVVVQSGEGEPGSLFVDNVRMMPQLASPCRPAPPEDVGESAASPVSPQTRWTFDDNKFCAAGPGLGCALPGIDPRPGADFLDSSNRSFEMYVVADCGTEMHVPLNDVESGCISVFHDEGVGNPPTPVVISVDNGAGFSQVGLEVCWTATDCSGFGNPGGPGDLNTMDVSFQGDPTLCGVYIVNFKSWAGCIWDLFANCDGTATEQFNIHDDICAARASVNPLPDLVIESMQTSDAGGCSVSYCAVVHNIGCQAATSFTLHAENEFDSEDVVVPALAAGESTQVCGTLDVMGAAVVHTVVTVTVDPADLVLECSEAANASSCNPAQGGNSLSNGQDIDCSCQPPDCDDADPCTTDSCVPGVGCVHDPLGCPPVLTVSTAVTCLWPPNHRFVDVGLDVAAAEGCPGPAPVILSVGVLSDETTATQLGAGGPRHCPDAIYDRASGQLLLRAERSGNEDGRVYTIVVTATDGCGHEVTASTDVSVPHDQDPKTPGQVPGNDPAGPCPAINSLRGVDATTCN
jgi:hypothetical protein